MTERLILWYLSYTLLVVSSGSGNGGGNSSRGVIRIGTDGEITSDGDSKLDGGSGSAGSGIRGAEAFVALAVVVVAVMIVVFVVVAYVKIYR